MKAKKIVKTSLAVALFAAAVLLCIDSASMNVNSVPSSATATNGCEKVDFDFTRMNPTVRMTHVYRLASSPTEFSGKTFRISGMFLTRVDEEDGKRYFGCLMSDPGGCSCCAPGGVLEFIPRECYVWPTNFPPSESRVTVTGRLKMFDIGPQEQSLSIPRLVDADISWATK